MNTVFKIFVMEWVRRAVATFELFIAMSAVRWLGLVLARWMHCYSDKLEFMSCYHATKVESGSHCWFQLVDFDTLLSHYDDRLTRSLNKKYLEQEWGFSKLTHYSSQMPRDIPPVDPAFRQRQASSLYL